MSSYRITLRETPEGIAQKIAEDHGDPETMTVEATSIEHVGDQADPALNVRLAHEDGNVTIWLEDIERITPVRTNP